MNFLTLLLLVLWQLFSKVLLIAAAENDESEEICPFRNTVNLTDRQMYENGSYLYQDILVPPEKQQLYDYDVKFSEMMIDVPTHLRGCVCEKKPCIKLCCPEDKYLYDNTNSSTCEKLMPDMEVSWNVTIELEKKQTKVVNIFEYFTVQVGLPCYGPEALDMMLDDLKLQHDGNLYVGTDNSLHGTLDYCYSPFLEKDSNKYILIPFSCPTRNVATWVILLNTYGMAISVIFLIPTILVYLALKELRGNLRGKLLICYLLSLTMGYAIISFINASGLHFGYISCSFLGFTCYFFFMAAFLWLSVLCYDIWKNFRETNIEFNSHKNQNQFIIYSLYAWLSAGFATGLIIYIQLSPSIDSLYKPDIGTDICWLNTEKWSAAIYFYGPNLLILLFNFVTFAHLTARIYNVRRDLARMTHKEKFFQENAIVILRLFLIMGISWLFDIISYCVRNYEEWEFLFVLSDFANAIQGILIFSLFVLKPNVLNLLSKKYHWTQIGKPRTHIPSVTTNFSRLQTSTSMTTPITP